jgi:hypothetical protein
MSFFSKGPLVKAAIPLLVFSKSGVSSPSALSAGDDSVPDTSENRSWSKDLRGVLKEGLRKGGAVFEDAVVEKIGGLNRGVLFVIFDSKPRF